MTVTLPAPTTTVERVTIQRAMALILAGSKTRACPIGINQNGPGSDILVVHWAGFVGLYQWTDFFGIEAQSVRRRVDGRMISASGSADWNGWHIQLSAIEPVATTDADTAALIDALATAPECVDCSMPGGHQESCAFASRVDPEAAAQIPVVVVELTPNPAPSTCGLTFALCCDGEGTWSCILSDGHEGCHSGKPETSDEVKADLARAHTLDMDCAYGPTDPEAPIPYIEADLDTPIEYLPVDEPTVRLPHPGVHYVPEGVHPRGYVPRTPADHDVPIVEVTDVTPGPLVERDDNAVMARVLPPQRLFAEAVDRLAADRLADAMLGEASGE